MQRDESLARSNVIDSICDRFERASLSGDAPAIESVLAEHPEVDRSRLLRELLLIEIRVRRQQGGIPATADYSTRFPDQSDIIDEAMQTIHLQSDATAETADFSLDATDKTQDPADSDDLKTVDPTSEAASTQRSSIALKAFGDYELLHEIARGGMGVVYKARQTKLNRIVALKMIKAGELAGDEEVKRFHTEAEAAAQLNHPGIVPIYEVGEQNGQHFFSMGFVDGTGLDAKLKEGPLPPLEATELTRQIAVAVQFAHEKGIVHRDLKPANVLIDSDGTTRITDFGLAKNISGDSGMTATGQVMGTPSYMPPEQAAGKADEIGPLADVYSLGALLYTLLVGRPPYQAASVVETLQHVVGQEPVSPRKLNASVSRDLETICLRCLEKVPHNRFETAQALADELQRVLERRPILARPVTLLERTRRWARRNPMIATLGAAFTTVVIVGATASAYYAVEARDNLKTADANLERFKSEKIRADEEAHKVKGLLLTVQRERDNVKGELTDHRKALKKYTDTVLNSRLLKEARFVQLKKTLLVSALEHYKRFTIKHANDATLQAEVADALFAIGKLSTETDTLTSQALNAYEQAVTIYKRLASQDPSATAYASRIASSLLNIGLIKNDTGQSRAALAHYREAIELQLELVKRSPSNAGYQSVLAKAHYNIGNIQLATREFSAALSSFEAAITIQERLTQRVPPVASHNHELAATHTSIGMLHSATGNAMKAAESFTESLSILRELAKSNPDVVEFQISLADCDNHLGNLYTISIRKPAAAMSAYSEALSILQKVARDNPTVPHYRFRLAECHGLVAALHQDNGRVEFAHSSFKIALSILKTLVVENPTVDVYRSALAANHNNCGALREQANMMEDALKHHKEAASLYNRLSLDNPTVPDYRNNLSGCYSNMGVVLFLTGRTEAAVSAERNALAVREKLVLDHPAVVEYRVDLGASYLNLAEFVQTDSLLKAHEYRRKAISQLTDVLGKSPSHVQARLYLRNAHWARAKCYDRSREYRKAADDWRHAIALDAGQQKRLFTQKLAASLAHSGEYVESTQLVAELSPGIRRAIDAYEICCIMAVTVHAAAGDYSIDRASRQQAASRQSKNAMTILKALKTTGFFKLPRNQLLLRTDPDLNALRSRDDFREFAKSVGVHLPAWALKPHSTVGSR